VRQRAKPIDLGPLLPAATDLFQARRSMLDAVRFLWNNPAEPFTPGHHTREVCARIDRAKADFRRGISTRLIVTIPFRHGKSDLSSRYGPATLLGWDQDLEIILASYGSQLSEDFSRDIKAIVDQPEFKRLFPTFPGWDPRTNAAGQRRVLGRRGKINALGMGGGATGKGAQVLILDDAFKNREEAESKTVRDSRWESFRSDFFSRLAPVHIIVIVQTRWHVDDIIGRIHAANDPANEAYDPEFPKFDTIHFRAKGAENVPHTGSEYLFPERFKDEWYKAQFGVAGAYAASALLQGEPYIRGGNMLKTDGITWLAPGEAFPSFEASPRWIRHWDLAHSAKELVKNDPDYTAGGRVAVIERKEGHLLLVDDLQLFREEATRRNELIIQAAQADRQLGIPQYIEANGAQKSAYTTLRDILAGVSVVSPYYPHGDKVTRAGYVEPIFEAGNVWIRCSPTIKGIALNQIANFPTTGVHDDAVDVLSDGYQCAIRRNTMSAGKAVANNIASAIVS